MSFSLMTFDKNWTNIADFPTHESQESKVRADMQYLFDSIKNQFNNFIQNEVFAGNIPYTPTGGLESDNIQGAIDAIQDEITDISQGSVADGSISTIKLDQTPGSEAVTSSTIRDGAILTSKLGNGVILTSKLADGVVTDAKLGASSVTTAKILNGAVTTDKIADNAVTTAKINNASVTVDKLTTNAVSTVKIQDSAVTTAKIANSAVTYAKTSGVQQQHSTTTASLSSGAKSWTVNVTGVTASNTVICTPAPASFAQWVDNRVRCTAQAAGKLTFTADTNTGAAITVNVLIMN